MSLDDLANFEPDKNLNVSVPPKGKHLFGVVTIGEKGQIVIPAKARKIFDISAGDRMLVLGDEGQGIAIVKADSFLPLAGLAKKIKY